MPYSKSQCYSSHWLPSPSSLAITGSYGSPKSLSVTVNMRTFCNSRCRYGLELLRRFQLLPQTSMNAVRPFYLSYLCLLQPLPHPSIRLSNRKYLIKHTQGKKQSKMNNEQIIGKLWDSIQLRYDLAILPLNIFPREMKAYVHTDL